MAITVYVLMTMILGVVSGVWLEKRSRRRETESTEDRVRQIVAEAEKEAAHIVRTAQLQAKEEIYAQRQAHAQEFAEKSRRLEEQIEQARRTEHKFEMKFEQYERAESELRTERQRLESRLEEAERSRTELDSRLRDVRRRLEVTAGLTADEARHELLKDLEAELLQESANLIRRVENETRETANKKARKLVTLAVQKCATEVVADSTASLVPLSSDDMKGRIIGREGRNIRSLEATTGVNIIVDDTPEAVVLSCFDPLRREVARVALERLLADGRIHPARIEEVVAKVEQELEEYTLEVGSEACFELNIHDADPEVMKLVGRLKYRTSFGQNILAHSIEVARIAATMAAELGADVMTAKRAGLFHDIGKAVSAEVDGPHALVGAEICRNCGETAAVVHAIAAHHNEEEPRTVVAVLIQAADAISASRPGARRESLDRYIKKLSHLEEIAQSFPGVEKAYALQAGREVRIMVEPDSLDDSACVRLARDVAKKIEDELQFPGQIKVTVLRETRVTDYAR